MSELSTTACERQVALDPRIRNIQPGGGWVFQLEYAWGFVRRWWLVRFWPKYVARMESCRVGQPLGVPHPVLDPRDLKLFRNQTSCHWQPTDDPFRWRDELPFVREGLAELLVFSVFFWGVAIVCWLPVLAGAVTGWQQYVWLLVGLSGAVMGGLVAWFFRNPARMVPTVPGQMVAPADGKIASIEIVHDAEGGLDFVEVGIFLSIFNVHINRVPDDVRVISIGYQPGKCLNALRPESARENEQTIVCLEQLRAPFQQLVVRQITGAIARRIVCYIKPGDKLRRGQPFGMIKLGSRTTLRLPQTADLQLLVKVGDRVQAGATVLACYSQPVEAA